MGLLALKIYRMFTISLRKSLNCFRIKMFFFFCISGSAGRSKSQRQLKPVTLFVVVVVKDSRHSDTLECTHSVRDVRASEKTAGQHKTTSLNN